jgi:uncharacterized cupin superfamily protein
MPRLNLTTPAFHYDDTDPPGFACGMFRFGEQLGATDTGCTVYELPPGQAICPYHFEYGEEEWLFVLAGRPTLRTPDGEEEIGPLEMVFFPKGPDGAHAVRNDTAETVRVLMFSTRVFPAMCEYPDSGKVGMFTADKAANLLVRRTSGVDYWDGETGERPAG